jgi:hypothetical protein
LDSIIVTSLAGISDIMSSNVAGETHLPGKSPQVSSIMPFFQIPDGIETDARRAFFGSIIS